LDLAAIFHWEPPPRTHRLDRSIGSRQFSRTKGSAREVEAAMMSNRVAGVGPSRRDATGSAGPTIRFADRLTCTVAEACSATGLGRTKLYELMGAGLIDSSTIGRRRLVQVQSLLKLVAPR
jgi:hypothetical protein